MSTLLATGKVRHIGIANFAPRQLSDLLENSIVRPFAHQMELHPYLPQSAWLQYHVAQNIRFIAFSPLGNCNPIYGYPPKTDPPRTIDHPETRKIAKRRGCTPAQVVLAWNLSRNVTVVPKSSHPDRMDENLKAMDCRLEYEDFADLRTLHILQSNRFHDWSGQWGVELYEGLDAKTASQGESE
jgi:alcohol dehydrogenase (NADP+)